MHPEKQGRLREELLSFSTTSIDPSYDDLTSLSLPYLNAVALEDDILPLMEPIRTASGALIDKIPIRKGTVLTTSLHYMNMAKSLWGADATEFKPERWFNGAQGVPASAKEYPGYHHTMIFSDGP
ncbi:Cytochrome P450 [Mycena venus]|uniref:Cytochrome P450 n=1 Tax=Mycena venus TaxID=2733690 RepID=A0A8H6YY84_9AGAR|nr:Cytochrome P450 [Mycena venus]